MEVPVLHVVFPVRCVTPRVKVGLASKEPRISKFRAGRQLSFNPTAPEPNPVSVVSFWNNDGACMVTSAGS
jgi:hypothetical protein